MTNDFTWFIYTVTKYISSKSLLASAESAYADNGFSNAPSSLRNRGQNYPPILPPRSNNPSVDERFSSEELPPDYGDNAFTPFFDDDDFEMESLGSDREDNWDDFEEVRLFSISKKRNEEGRKKK